jgi:transposase-like protein
MAEAKQKHPAPVCPSCGSTRTRRSVRKGTQEWVLHSLLFKSPYRCRDCDLRFFGFRQPRHEPDSPTTKHAH